MRSTNNLNLAPKHIKISLSESPCSIITLLLCLFARGEVLCHNIISMKNKKKKTQPFWGIIICFIYMLGYGIPSWLTPDMIWQLIQTFTHLHGTLCVEPVYVVFHLHVELWHTNWLTPDRKWQLIQTCTHLHGILCVEPVYVDYSVHLHGVLWHTNRLTPDMKWQLIQTCTHLHGTLCVEPVYVDYSVPPHHNPQSLEYLKLAIHVYIIGPDMQNISA